MSVFTEAYRVERAARTQRARPARTPLLVHAGRLAARALPSWETARTVALSYGGFGALTWAAFEVATPLGLAAAGVSLLVLEALGGDRR